MSAVTGHDVPDIELDYHTEYFGEGYYQEEVVQFNSDDFISGPYLSEQCTISDQILELEFSFGYDCKRHYNLVAPDENTIVFASGNLIHFYDVEKKEFSFRRSYLGGGLGHITLNPNPNYPHLAVAENGEDPPIILYEWPSMDIAGILKGGAAKRFAHINYSPEGDLLASQSYGPDFLITVWKWSNWRHSPIILRTKSHVQDIYRVMFSPYVPGHITTGGAGHIKFWRMAQTFTGLKLKGEVGRFGKTEISDVIGIYPMPDEKVISGSEWGNLLIWEGGLIKVEVFRTLRRRCHSGPVMQLEYDVTEDELWSISQDGWLRAWDYRKIDEADPPDEDRIVQIVPTYERETPGVQFMCICKKSIYNPDDFFYYAQDGNGGIWMIDLVLRNDHRKPERLMRCHAGPVAGMAACPWGTYIASLGQDGRIQIYDYMLKKLLYFYQFSANGRAIFWLPLSIDATGNFLILGFDDGVIRICTLNLASETNIYITITQSLKPHGKPITLLSINLAGTLLVSGGEDNSIFIFQLKNTNLSITLRPIGFIWLESTVTCFTWKPDTENILLAGCLHGQVYELEVPTHVQTYTKISYFLHTIKPKKQRFTTCKAQIRRDIYMKEIEERKAEKLEVKRQNLKQVKADNPGLDIDEEAFLADSEEDEVLEPLHIPEVPNRIWFLMYTPEDTIWFSMGGYDAGYIYEYTMNQEEIEPATATLIEDCDDIEMQSYLYSHDERYLITSMQHGEIRINRVNPANFRDLTDYWQLSMHDNFNGEITRMCFSYDHKYFFSCGTDGNVFSYKYQPEEGVAAMPKHTRQAMPFVEPAEVDESYTSYSLEETMIHAEEDKQLRLANEHKRKLRVRLKELTVKLSSLLERNCNLPKSQRITLRQFVIDNRIMKALDNTLEAKVALERRKIEYDVEKSTIALRKLKKHYIDSLDVFPITVKSFETKFHVSTLPQKGLKNKFFEMYGKVNQKVMEEKLQDKEYKENAELVQEVMPEREEVVSDVKTEMKKKQRDLEPFLVGLSPSTLSFKLGARLTRLLQKYRDRKSRIERRTTEWADLNLQKPIEGANHPDDERALAEAMNTIGDFKLKTAKDYQVPPEFRDSTVTKYQQILATRLFAYKTMIHSYNLHVYELRAEKVRMVDKLNDLEHQLIIIHEQLPEDRIIEIGTIPQMTPEDFPEKELELNLNVEKDYASAIKPKRVVVKEAFVEKVDIEREVLIGEDRLVDIQGTSEDIVKHVIKKLSGNIDPRDALKRMQGDDDKVNDLEKILKGRRLIRQMYRQDQLHAEIRKTINDFDATVKQAYDKCFQVRTNATFLDLHLLVLNQELVIVKEFESVENNLRDVALSKLNEMLDMRDKMKRVELNMEARLKQIEINNDLIKELQQTFNAAAKDNKFWDFLRRVFKKKYKPPKVYNPDESESSSDSSESSTDSEEDDTASLDSRDIGPIRLDENICPKGCDREIYDYTFSLRGQRHELEKGIKEEQRQIELGRKDLEVTGKKMKFLDLSWKKSQSDLEEYQRLKQLKLNEISCTTILRLDQLQHMMPDNTTPTKLSDVLVFNASALTRLFGRVSELQQETLIQRAKHRKNRLHLHRMTVDCHHMQITIAELRKEIVESMIIKFGRKIDIDDLEEAILKRMVLELRISLLNVKEVYDRELARVRALYEAKQNELKHIIRENTARLELLALLNREKAELTKLLQHQEKKKHADKKEDFISEKDIEKLSTVAQSQKEQIEALKRDIKMLNTKSLPLKPIEHIEKLEPIEEPVLDGDFGSLDEEYIGPELQVKCVDYMKEKYVEKITEDEILECIKDLLCEIVEAIKQSGKSQEEMIVIILSDMIDQIPMTYFDSQTTLEFITTQLVKILSRIGSINSDSIIQRVSQITGRSLEEVRAVTSKISEYSMSKDKERKDTETEISLKSEALKKDVKSEEEIAIVEPTKSITDVKVVKEEMPHGDDTVTHDVETIPPSSEEEKGVIENVADTTEKPVDKE